MDRGTVILLLTLAATACDRQASSTIAAPSAPGVSESSSGVVHGFVYDTAHRLVSGVAVEVIAGARSSTSTTTNDKGVFELQGVFERSITLRAHKEGYFELTQSLTIPPNSSPGYTFVSLYLESRTPPVDVAGDYTLTVIVDSACVDIPGDARLRRYDAVIRPTSTPTYFRGIVGGGSFLGDYNWFSITVAGDYVSFNVDFDGPTIVEQLSERTYLAIDGSAGASVGMSKLTSPIDVPFDAGIDYCALNTDASPTNYAGCDRRDQVVAHSFCSSTSHRLTLRRR